MSSSLSAFVICALVVASSAAPVRAQSLGDVAKREAERRKAVKDTGRVLTNKDVPRVPQSDPPAASSPASEADAAEKGAAPDKAAAPEKGDAKDAGDTKDEKYWVERQKAVQSQLERDQFYMEALQTRVNALTTDYVNRDDPARRAGIGDERQKVLEEISRIKLAIVADQKAVTDFEDEAHRAGVPPGWLR